MSGAPRSGSPTRLIVAACACSGLAIFAIYWRTLLPGMDLGDSASFQTIAGSRLLTPRHAYPLYFAIANVFTAIGGVWGVEPALALNIASAVCGALACGVICAVGIRISGSVAGGLFAALLFGSSYTFWSQAIIAEVYALHILAMALSLLTILRWAAQPSMSRLALFFLVYAISFGNHLSSILFLPGFGLFLLAAEPRGWRGMLQPRVVCLALGIAALGALPYAWNVHGMLTAPDAPTGLADAARAFWFDVSKSDWRDSLVGAVPSVRLAQRVAMCWFDARQQFGVAGLGLALVGLIHLVIVSPRIAAMLVTHYLVSFAFAFTYNVGDVHVFFLPCHLIVALFSAPAVSAVWRAFHATADRRAYALISACLLAYPIWRVYDTLPAVDRSWDRRPLIAVQRLAAGLSPEREVLATGLTWELQNGLDYYGRYVDRSLIKFRIRDMLPHFPFFVRDNGEIGRDIVLVGSAGGEVIGAFGDLFRVEPDPRAAAPPFSTRVAGISPGTPYVLCVLAEHRDYPVDRRDLARAARALGLDALPATDYLVVVGSVGRPPVVQWAGARPFRETLTLSAAEHRLAGGLDLTLDVRIESWLTFDTIRRAGYGHVVVNGQHTLTIERGISFVTLDGSGRPAQFEYEGSAFEPQERQVIRTGR